MSLTGPERAGVGPALAERATDGLTADGMTSAHAMTSADAMTSAPGTEHSPRVASALARLGETGDLPAAEQIAVYEDIIRRLHDALTESG